MLEPVAIPDHSFSRFKDVGHTWGYGNNLAVIPTNLSSKTKSSASAFQQTSTKLFTISWERTLYNPCVRKLVNESCSAFTAIQTKATTENQIGMSELIKSSHQYRCIINACVEDLNHAADLSESTEKNQMFQEMSEIFYKAELVWSLCEIMYLENPIGILPHLQEWICIHFPNAVDETSKEFVIT